MYLSILVPGICHFAMSLQEKQGAVQTGNNLNV